LRVEAARGSLGAMIDRMYSRDGRLTGGGLRMLQRFIGKHDPGVVSIALEPIYFSMPAERDEVRAEAERLLDLAEAAARGATAPRDRLDVEMRKLQRAPLRAFRFIPVATFVPRIVAALDESRRVGRRWSECVEALAGARRGRGAVPGGHES
jgi:hypothetical protein